MISVLRRRVPAFARLRCALARPPVTSPADPPGLFSGMPPALPPGTPGPLTGHPPAR